MVIYLNQDGSAQKVVPERIFQGTNNVIAIDVIAPYAPTTALEIAFTLPNRQQTTYMPMTYVTAVISGAQTASAWEYVLQSNVTEYEGTVLISINAIGKNGNKTSYSVNFNVERSILPDLPPAPTPDVYQLLLQYIQQNSMNIINLDKRVTDLDGSVADLDERVIVLDGQVTDLDKRVAELESTSVQKVLRDFTVNSETGEGVKYYSDGTTATVQFPTGGGTAPSVQSNWIKVITFSESDFNVNNELAFSAQQTGFDDSKYIALIDRSGTAEYKAGDETVTTVHDGFWQTANTFFKGTDGSIYMQFNKPFSGRLVLLGGAVFSGNFLATVDYNQSNNELLFTKVDGTVETMYLPEPSVGLRYVKDYTENDWQGADAPYTISVSSSIHGRGVNPLVYTGMQVFNIMISDDGTVIISSTIKKAFKLIII